MRQLISCSKVTESQLAQSYSITSEHTIASRAWKPHSCPFHFQSDCPYLVKMRSIFSNTCQQNRVKRASYLSVHLKLSVHIQSQSHSLNLSITISQSFSHVSVNLSLSLSFLSTSFPSLHLSQYLSRLSPHLSISSLSLFSLHISSLSTSLISLFSLSSFSSNLLHWKWHLTTAFRSPLTLPFTSTPASGTRVTLSSHLPWSGGIRKSCATLAPWRCNTWEQRANLSMKKLPHKKSCTRHGLVTCSLALSTQCQSWFSAIGWGTLSSPALKEMKKCRRWQHGTGCMKLVSYLHVNHFHWFSLHHQRFAFLLSGTQLDRYKFWSAHEANWQFRRSWFCTFYISINFFDI